MAKGLTSPQIIWLRKALRNFDEEASRIAEDDSKAASLIVERIMHAVDLLASQPALGKPGRVPGTRELQVARTRYLIPYRLRANREEILRVFHTSRKPPAKW